jgi:hypothetical protein
VIDLETRISGFDARSWNRLITVVAPGLASRAPHEWQAHGEVDGGTLVVFFQHSRILAALHSRRGAIPLDDDAWRGRHGLEQLARDHRSHFVIACEAGALEEFYERIGGRLTLGDDDVTTCLVVLGALRELLDEGAILLWPDLVPARVPLPTPAVVHRTLDFLLPDDHAALVALFDDDSIDTAVLAHRRDGSLQRVLGPEVLRDLVGPLGGDFRRDYRVIRSAIERNVGPLAWGVYTTTPILHDLLRSTKPSAWAEAIATRDVVLDPMPAWMAIAAGAGVVREAAARSRSVLSGLGVLSALTPVARRVKEFSDNMAGFDPTRAIGFNPLRALSIILRQGSWESPERTDDPSP